MRRWILALCVALAAALALPADAGVNNSLGATAAPPGNVRLTAASATSLQLCPYQGNKLMINVNVYVVPAGCVTVTNGGLAATTLYYVYAFISAGSITLEVVVTGHITSAVTGVEVKSGDATRTLVGMVLTQGSTPGQFLNAAATRQVASWFNRLPTNVQGASTAGQTCTSTGFTEITSAARATLVTWAQAVLMGVTGQATSDTAGGGVNSNVSRDNSGSLFVNRPDAQNPSANLVSNLSGTSSDMPPEGNHFYTPQCAVAAATTGTYSVNVDGIVWQ